MATDNETIAKCPFCMDGDTTSVNDPHHPVIRIRCNNCGASGGWFDTKAEAIETWNWVSEAVDRVRED